MNDKLQRLAAQVAAHMVNEDYYIAKSLFDEIVGSMNVDDALAFEKLVPQEEEKIRNRRRCVEVKNK